MKKGNFPGANDDVSLILLHSVTSRSQSTGSDFE